MPKRCEVCDNCKKLNAVKPSILANCGTPKIRGGKHVGTNHADDDVVAVWNRSVAELPCLNPRMTDEEYADKQKAIFDEAEIPEELRGALSYYAYEHGHSAGMEEVLVILQNLVSPLAEPVKKLMERCKKG